jgi:hypothetical protein
MVCEEQSITPDIYYHDAVWPSVALRKLVGDVAVGKEDLDRGFIANYGPRVRCRVIMMTNQRRAQEVWEMARGELQKKNPDPEFFGKLAEQYSVDPKGYTEPVKVEMADVKDVLYDDIHQRKLHMAMADEFNRLKESAQIDNYLTGAIQVPKKSGAAGHGDGNKAAAISNPSAEYRK